jgi:hypothetical protein
MKTTDPRTDPRYMRDPRGYGYRKIEDVLRDAAKREREAHERSQRATQRDPRLVAIEQAYLRAPDGQRGHRPTLFAIAEHMDPAISDDTLLRLLKQLGISGARELHRRMGR